MNELRNDKELTTADIVNPERTRDTRTATLERADERADEQAAVARDQRSFASNAARESMPDLDDTTDPRLQNTNLAERQPERTAAQDTRPVQSVAADYTTSPSAERAPVSTATAAASAAGREPAPSANNASGAPAQLFPDDELHNFRAQWDQVQASFVDEPRQAVERADSLVANVVKRIAEQFAEERARLEKQWDRGDDVSTEDLRQGLKRYRSFFDRLLSF